MSRKTHLISVDPGKLSGFVVLDITQTLLDGSTPDVVDSSERGQLDTCYTVHELLSEAQSSGIVYKLVCEDFIITTQTGKKTDTRYSLEIIGALRYLCGLYGVKMTLQKPAEAKAFVSNDRIRNMNLWQKGGEGHMKDAMRHAIFYMTFVLNLEVEGLLSK